MAASCFFARFFIQFIVSPSIVSANFVGCIENPVVNISGSTMTSEGKEISFILFVKILLFSDGFSQTKSVCMNVILISEVIG